ncbi:TIGR03032 family protein [Spirulina subsalsa]|uniref:TIGR03032 family protein n=1 Tax=Spirulina subsalsa TaxID=54311 RepID=UPI0002DC18FC|nr:TIGR03032 family protein [Spirulina subsalsa]
MSKQFKNPPFEYIYSPNFPEILESLNISLFISTYQVGKLIVVRSQNGYLSTLLRNFKHLMGLALNQHCLALGTKREIWFLPNVPGIAHKINPPEQYDGCFVPRKSHITGDIRVHELAWVGEELWFVNTRFSCLCTLEDYYNFVPRWQPPFITELVPEDRCHLNGLAVVNSKPQYVTFFQVSNVAGEWRKNRKNGGCVMDIESGDVLNQSFSMPHSPRVYNNRLWVLNSGYGELVVIDEKSGEKISVVQLPGFTRGLTFCGNYAFIGLSQIREKKTFGGLPIEQQNQPLQCAVWVVDIVTGKAVASLKFVSGCTELFDVQVLPNIPYPTVVGFQKNTLNKIFIF